MALEGREKIALVIGDTSFGTLVSEENPLPVSNAMTLARNVLTANGESVAGATEIMPGDTMRRGLTLRNDSDTKMYFRTDGAAADGVGYPLDAGRGYSFEASALMPMNPISLWCSVAGKRWAALYSTDA